MGDLGSGANTPPAPAWPHFTPVWVRTVLDFTPVWSQFQDQLFSCSRGSDSLLSTLLFLGWRAFILEVGVFSRN